jgi:hypothetical protein
MHHIAAQISRFGSPETARRACVEFGIVVPQSPADARQALMAYAQQGGDSVEFDFSLSANSSSTTPALASISSVTATQQPAPTVMSDAQWAAHRHATEAAARTRRLALLSATPTGRDLVADGIAPTAADREACESDARAALFVRDPMQYLAALEAAAAQAAARNPRRCRLLAATHAGRQTLHDMGIDPETIR